MGNDHPTPYRCPFCKGEHDTRRAFFNHRCGDVRQADRIADGTRRARASFHPRRLSFTEPNWSDYL